MIIAFDFFTVNISYCPLIVLFGDLNSYDYHSVLFSPYLFTLATVFTPSCLFSQKNYMCKDLSFIMTQRKVKGLRLGQDQCSKQVAFR